MRFLKKLGPAAVLAVAVTGLVGNGTAAGAGVICENPETPCNVRWANGTNLEYSLQNKGTSKITTTEDLSLDTCTGSGLGGSLTNGSSTSNASLSIAKGGLTWSGCTNTTATLAGGTLEVSYGGSGHGVVYAKGLEVTVNTSFFGSCIFSAGTGVVLGSVTEGGAGISTLSVTTVLTRLSGLCPSTEKWIATYTLTKPTGKTFYVSNS
jgi:hypothetical protein